MSKKITVSLKKGEGAYGTAEEYGPYVNYGTRRTAAQPFMTSSIFIVKAKATGVYTENLDKSIFRGLRKQFKKRITDNMEFIGCDIDDELDLGVELSAEELVAAGSAQAKAMCPVDTGTLRKSVMWKTSKKEGGFGTE